MEEYRESTLIVHDRTSLNIHAIILEFAQLGSLRDLLNSSLQSLSEPTLRFFFRQMAQAVQQLQRRKVVHHDIKVDNFVIMDRETLTLKLIDFGLSAINSD